MSARRGPPARPAEIENARLVTRVRVDFGALLATLAHGVRRDDHFAPLGVEAAFELYRWMTTSVTGKNYDRWSWPTRWTRESLSMNMSSRVNCGASNGDEITPFRSSYDRHQDARPPWGWREELASRFAHALLDGGKMAEWRRAMGIEIAKPRIVPLLVYQHVPPPPRAALYGFSGSYTWSPSYGDPTLGRHFGGEVDRLFALASPARRLHEQFNTSYPEARYLKAVLLRPTPEGWIASIEYGFDGSAWSEDFRIKSWSKRARAKDKTACAQRRGEPFANFIYRAHDQFAALLTPACTKARASCDRPARWATAPQGKLYGELCGKRCEVGP